MRKFSRITLLIMFGVLLKLFGCKRKDEKPNSSISKDTLQQQIDKSIDDFNNRPIYHVLTEQIIDTTPDEKLLQTIFDNLSSKLPKDYSLEYKTVLSWNKSQQAIYMIWWLEAEVNNGGYDQFYENSSGQFNKLLPDALKLVGANKLAELTQRANEVYQKIKNESNTEGDLLGKFDKEFYKLEGEEEVEKIQIKYIRSHKVDFINK